MKNLPILVRKEEINLLHKGFENSFGGVKN